MKIHLTPHQSGAISAASRQTVGYAGGLRREIEQIQYLRRFTATAKFTQWPLPEPSCGIVS